VASANGVAVRQQTGNDVPPSVALSKIRVEYRRVLRHACAVKALGLIQFIGFCAGFVLLLDGYRHFPTLNSFLGLLLLVAWLVLGTVALLRAYGSSDSPSMLTFLGALPQRWRKWFLGK